MLFPINEEYDAIKPTTPLNVTEKSHETNSIQAQLPLSPLIKYLNDNADVSLSNIQMGDETNLCDEDWMRDPISSGKLIHATAEYKNDTFEVNFDFNITTQNFSQYSLDIIDEFIKDEGLNFQNEIQIESTTETIYSDFDSFNPSNCSFETGLKDASELTHINEHLKDTTTISLPTKNEIKDFSKDINFCDKNVFDAEVYQSVTAENTACNKLNYNISSKNTEENKLLSPDDSTCENIEDLEVTSNQAEEHFGSPTSSHDLNQEKREIISYSNEKSQVYPTIYLGMSFYGDFECLVSDVNKGGNGKNIKSLDCVSDYNSATEGIHSQQRNNFNSPSSSPQNSDISNFDDLIKFNYENKGSEMEAGTSNDSNIHDKIQNQNENSLDEIFKLPLDVYSDVYSDVYRNLCASVNDEGNYMLVLNSSQHSNKDYENHDESFKSSKQIMEESTNMNVDIYSSKNENSSLEIYTLPDWDFENYYSKISKSLIDFNSPHSENLHSSLDPYSSYDDTHNTTNDFTNGDESPHSNQVTSQTTPGKGISFRVWDADCQADLETLHNKYVKFSESTNSDESFKSPKQIMEENTDMNVDILSSESEDTSLDIITVYRDSQHQNESITEKESQTSHDEIDKMFPVTKLIFNCLSADKLSGSSTTVISISSKENMAIIVPDISPQHNSTDAKDYSLHLDKFNRPFIEEDTHHAKDSTLISLSGTAENGTLNLDELRYFYQNPETEPEVTMKEQTLSYDETKDSMNTNDITQNKTETTKADKKYLPVINKKVEIFLCPVCQRELRGKLSSILHQCVCKVKPYICVYCEMRFGSKYFLKKHLKAVHIIEEWNKEDAEGNEGKVNACTKQNYIYEEINGISSTDSERENEECQRSKGNKSKCATILGDVDKLNKNSDSTQGGKNFRETERVARNYSSEASPSEKTSSSPKSSKRVINTDKNFRTNTNYYYRKRFKCNVCRKAYSFKSQLKRHELRHKPNPYICSFCPKSYTLFKNLKNHSLIHGLTLTTPYNCEKCGYIAQSGSELNFHMKKHNTTDLAYCQHCKYTSKSIRDLRKHVIRKHTRKFKHNCTLCYKGFITPKELKMHTERIHNQKLF